MKKHALIAALLTLGALTGPVFAVGDGHHDHAQKTAGHDEDATGQAGDAAKVSRSVAVEMNDTMRYTPARIAVKRGETIKFVLTNNGKLRHEMVLASVKELKEHAAMMKKFPEMVHAEANMVTVEPGKTGDLIWHFTKAGSFEFACLQPGHFEAGMIGKVAVK